VVLVQRLQSPPSDAPAATSEAMNSPAGRSRLRPKPAASKVLRTRRRTAATLMIGFTPAAELADGTAASSVAGLSAIRQFPAGFRHEAALRSAVGHDESAKLKGPESRTARRGRTQEVQERA